jgi:hypothetical protein
MSEELGKHRAEFRTERGPIVITADNLMLSEFLCLVDDVLYPEIKRRFEMRPSEAYSYSCCFERRVVKQEPLPPADEGGTGSRAVG